MIQDLKELWSLIENVKGLRFIALTVFALLIIFLIYVWFRLVLSDTNKAIPEEAVNIKMPDSIEKSVAVHLDDTIKKTDKQKELASNSKKNTKSKQINQGDKKKIEGKNVFDGGTSNTYNEKINVGDTYTTEKQLEGKDKEYILARINLLITENSITTPCIVIQHTNSNSGKFILQLEAFLKEKGFPIAGRGTRFGEYFQGVKLIFEMGCITIVVGV